MGRIREGRLRFLPGLPEPPCTARAAPSFLHPRGSGHLKISSVRQGRSLAVHSGPASLCSARAAQATTVCPGRWGGRWGHPGQPPWESSGSGSPPWVHAGPTVSELGPQAQLRGGPASGLPSVTMRRGRFAFCSLPLLILAQGSPFPFLSVLFWSLKHQKGSGVPLIRHRV